MCAGGGRVCSLRGKTSCVLCISSVFRPCLLFVLLVRLHVFRPAAKTGDVPRHADVLYKGAGCGRSVFFAGSGVGSMGRPLSFDVLLFASHLFCSSKFRLCVSNPTGRAMQKSFGIQIRIAMCSDIMHDKTQTREDP